jgi:transposase
MDAEELPTDVEALKAMVRKLVASNAQLTSANTQLKSSNTQLCETVSDQRDKLAAKDQQILELLKALRGKQRERVDPDQLLLFEIGELEKLIEEQLEDNSKRKAKKKRKRHGRVIPDGLPEEIIDYEIPEEERLCPVDGKAMPRIRWEISKQLDYIPAKMKVIVHRRAVYACSGKHDEATLLIANKPPQPIEKGLAAAGLLSQVIVSKFGDHLPGYRLEDIFSRHGVNIRRSTIYDWLAQSAELCRPLFELMRERVLSSNVIHTDDTKVKLIDKALKHTRTARFWAYLGDASNPYTVYDFTEDRSRDGPAKFLTGYRGYLQADAYSSYDGIYLESDGQIVEVACWAHCRRYWHKAKEQDPENAHHALSFIGRLYEIERATGDADARSRHAARQEHALPLLAEFSDWLDEQSFLPKSLIGKALTYTRNQWSALNRYVESGELSIDNNPAERAMRPVAIGRKNWLFVGSPAAGDRAAILMSLIASCKRNGVEPWAYMKDVLQKLAGKPDKGAIVALLPDKWLIAKPQHRWNIDDIRRNERNAKT